MTMNFGDTKREGKKPLTTITGKVLGWEIG